MRLLFLDFSSAFNTIQTELLRDKLENSGGLPPLTLDSGLRHGPTTVCEDVRTKDCASDMVVCSTGGPQGAVLVPFLFTLYTTDFRHNSTNCHLQKFSDDSAMVGLITDENDRVQRTECGENQRVGDGFPLV